jgi:hypothetical protein
MKKISVDPMNSALAVLETLGSVLVERCTEQSCEVCAQELDVAA